MAKQDDSFTPLPDDQQDTFTPADGAAPASPEQHPLSPLGQMLQAALMGGVVTPPILGSPPAMRGGAILGRSPDEARSRLSALPWAAGAASMPLAALLGPLGMGTIPALAGMAGREAQLRLGNDVPVQGGEHAKSVIGSGASVGLNLGLPELAAAAPGMVARKAEAAVQKAIDKRAAEAVLRSNENVAARTSVAPSVRAASSAASAARRAAGEDVGAAIRSASEGGAPPITSQEIADRIAANRQTITGKPIPDAARKLIQKDVERQWLRQARSMPGTIEIGGIQPETKLLDASGRPISRPKEPLTMSLEDAHISHRIFDKRARAAIVASKGGKSSIADLMLDIANAQRQAIAERGGEGLATANKAFSEAARTDQRLRAAVSRIPTPQEVELRRIASARAADAMARVPTDEPLVSWHGGNIVTGRVPFPRPNGPQAVARIAGHPRTQMAAGAAANVMRAAGAPFAASPADEEQRLLGAYRGRKAELQDIFNRLPQSDVRNRELLQRVLAQL
jgi:hypothetical protein